MKKLTLFWIVILFYSFVPFNVISETHRVQVDWDVILKVNVKGASGANLSWLLDSDTHRPRPRSMQTALTEMGVGSLRFPYGHLADNYLWTTPPYANAVKGLSPRVATQTQTPAQWEWAVHSDGTFKKALDFDEYIALCKAVGAEPLVVVNVLSHTYNDGPSLEYLIESAVEWVRYSNVTRKYNVKFWQLGNEVEHKQNITLEEYDAIFGRMAVAMKAVDPSIKVGTGVLGNVTWNRRILENHLDLVGFVSAHQYAFNQPFTERGYEGWKNLSTIELKNIRRMQRLLQEKSEYNEIPLMITETGATGGKWPEGRVNDLYKALYWFEMNMEQLVFPNVLYSYFWSTHTPWGGENVETALENLLTNKENKNTPTGEIVQLINQHMPCVLVKTQYPSGYVRIYAGVSSDEEKRVIFALNKNDSAENISILLSGMELNNYVCKTKVFTGKEPADQFPFWQHDVKIQIKNQSVEGELLPYSITVIQLTKKL